VVAVVVNDNTVEHPTTAKVDIMVVDILKAVDIIVVEIVVRLPTCFGVFAALSGVVGIVKMSTLAVTRLVRELLDSIKEVKWPSREKKVRGGGGLRVPCRGGTERETTIGEGGNSSAPGHAIQYCHPRETIFVQGSSHQGPQDGSFFQEAKPKVLLFSFYNCCYFATHDMNRQPPFLFVAIFPAIISPGHYSW